MSDNRLSIQRFHILVSLADRDRHGSDIVRDVLAQTEGAVRLWPATLYGTLDALVSEGLIEELTGADRPEGVSERRRYYRLTQDGRRALAGEAQRLADMAGAARERLARA